MSELNQYIRSSVGESDILIIGECIGPNSLMKVIARTVAPVRIVTVVFSFGIFFFIRYFITRVFSPMKIQSYIDPANSIEFERRISRCDADCCLTFMLQMIAFWPF